MTLKMIIVDTLVLALLAYGVWQFLRWDEGKEEEHYEDGKSDATA